MRFALTSEQELLRGELRRFLEQRAPLTATRRRLDAGIGHDPAIWHAMASELGLLALGVPEELGGPGTGAVDMAVAMEELGRVLFPGPFLASATLATRALVHAGDAELLGSLLDGDRIAALAHADDGGAWDPDGVATTATDSGAELVLSGGKRHVVHADVADLLLVAARRPGSDGADGIVLAAVQANAPGVERRVERGLDPTRPQATVGLDAARGWLVAEQAAPLLGRTLDEAGAALGAEIVGAATRSLELTVEHLGQRTQFGRPIGSFQALKHRCADMLVELEHARSAAYVAACRTAEAGTAGGTAAAEAALAEAAAQALATCGAAGARIARETIQLHGGIGFTWEHDAHLLLRRLRAAEYLLGTPAAHRERLWSMTAPPSTARSR